MKKQPFFIIILFSFALFSSCLDDDGFFQSCEHGDGPVVEEVLNVSGFTGVKVASAVDVYISQGPEFEVLAVGEQNIIDLLERNVKNDIWVIEFDECVRHHDLEVYITMPEVNYLAMSGSGDITGETFIDAEDITLRISGSGDICLGLYAERIDGKISGSGNMDLEGEGEFMDFDITGSGDLEAFSLILERADVNISGSGDMSVHVLEELRVRISGSGDVYYKGQPYIDLDISGSGDVIDAN